MAAGELVAEGSPGEIKRGQRGHLLEFVVDQPQRAADILKTESERWRVSLFGTRLHVVVDVAAAAGQDVTTRRLEAEGVHVTEVREVPFSLEDVFISVVAKARARRTDVAEEPVSSGG
jgi:ABC-2 type transport system ATP-binding protein